MAEIDVERAVRLVILAAASQRRLVKSEKGRWIVVPENWHPPFRVRRALLDEGLLREEWGLPYRTPGHGGGVRVGPQLRYAVTTDAGETFLRLPDA